MLEKQIEEMTAKLEAVRIKQNSLERVQLASNERDDLQSSQASTKMTADGMGKKWTTLKSLVPFQPLVLAKDRVHLAYIGPCPNASVSVEVQTGNDGFVSCFANIDPSVYPKNRSRNTDKLKRVMEFMMIRTKFVCDQLSAISNTRAAEVGKLVRRNIWELLRVKSTANEICKLQRRYDAILNSDTSHSTRLPQFELEVNLSKTAARDTKRVTAVFEVSESYPFGQMNFQLDVLEGNVDVDALYENVAKATKPGQGSLVRICDVLSASMP